MILFHSRHCQHCAMLMDNVGRYDPDSRLLKTVCVDEVRVPPRVHSVPALMLLPSRELLFGRAALDYLLLPNRGKLVVGSGAPEPSHGAAAPGSAHLSQPAHPGEPEGVGAVCMFEPLGAGATCTGLPWETLAGADTPPPVHLDATAQQQVPYASSGIPRLPQSMGVGVETRAGKALPSLEELQKARDQDI
jgi:hypothetical protein